MDGRRISALIIILYLALSAPLLEAQELTGIMTILGMQEEELLPEQEVERFEHLARNPVEINMYSASRLLASGLFSQYQVASLLDYRSTYGDILSIEELSSVDGFGKILAEALRPYVSLYSKALPGQTGRPVLRTETSLRMVFRPEATYKGKVVLDYGTRASAAVTGSSLGDRKYGYTFHAAMSGRRHLDRLVVGDFNARFGQGLALWSGFSLSGIAAPSSLYRRPTGISPSSSYSTTGLRGVAASLSFGRVTLSALSGMSLPVSGKPLSVTPGVNIGYLMKYGQFSLTSAGNFKASDSGTMVYDMLKIGLDARFCFKGTDLFGEVGTDLSGMSMAGLGGAVFRIGEDSKIGLLGRYYPRSYSKELTGAVKSGTYARDEAALSLSFERKALVLSTDLYRKLTEGRDQVKFLATHDIALGGNWTIKPRMSVRYRRGSDLDLKTELRTDISWNRVPWSQTVRVDWMRYVGNGFLGYYELGLQKEVLTAYFRATAFLIDNWDDRIYSYERDAPGNFNVPAYYGRGFSLNLNGAWKPRLRKGRLRLYLGVYYKEAEKPGRSVERNAGLRFQSVFSF